MVLFLGVLYHLKHPWLALEKVAAVTGPGGLIIIDTITDFGPAPRPAVAYYFGSEVNGDPTTWCAPNAAAVTGMLRDAGCQAVTNPVPNYWGNRAVFHALKGSDARVESHGRREHYQRHKYHPPGAP
jgi:tRNA (mo5U34)-methyltransferase